MEKRDFIATIENIYFSLNLIENYNDYYERKLKKILQDLRLQSENNELFIAETIQVIQGIKRYPYGFKIDGKYRIFFASKVGDNYPVYIIVNAEYLHMTSIFIALEEIKETIKIIMSVLDQDFKLNKYDLKLSRLDICNHNTKINVETYIKPKDFNNRTVTRIRKVHSVFELIGEKDVKLPYYRFGSGSLAIRFYNKTKEVIEQQYKQFFFKKWYENGLINEKQKKIFETCFILNGKYEVDFLYAHLISSDKVTYEDLDHIRLIYKSHELESDQKYDEFKRFIKHYKIKLVKEVTNVEYQIRGDYLRTIKIIDQTTGEFIDYTNIIEVLNHINELYRHLTHDSFRVINMNDNKARKRNKEVDPIWKQVQNSSIENIADFKLDTNIYREYTTKFDIKRSTRTTTKNLAHLLYLKQDELTHEMIDELTINDLVKNSINEYSINENLLNIRDQLHKQIKYYGEKKKATDLDNQ